MGVLDGEALFEHPDVPSTVTEALSRNDEGGTTAGAGLEGQEAILLAEVGPLRLALPIETIHSVMPRPVVKRSAIDSELCLGLAEHAGWRIPIVDPAALFGFGRLAADSAAEGVVLRLPSGLVGLAVSRVVAIVRLDRHDLRALPPIGLARRELYLGVWEVNGDDWLMVEVGALATDPDLAAMASINLVAMVADHEGPVEGLSSDTSAGGGPGAFYLACQAGVGLAVPLDQVREIVPYPAKVIRSATGRGDLQGMFVHRQAVVPLIDLAALAGRPGGRRADDGAKGPVVVVDTAAGPAGFAVERLDAIVRSTWEDGGDGQPAWRPRPDGSFGPDELPTLRVGDNEQGRLVGRLDLRAVANRLVGLTDDTYDAAPTPAPARHPL